MNFRRPPSPVLLIRMICKLQQFDLADLSKTMLFYNGIEDFNRAFGHTSLHNTATAIKKRAQFFFHKPENHATALALPGQKGFDVFSHHAIKNALFGSAGVILISGFADIEPLACE
jgi:hypothetical protein